MDISITIVFCIISASALLVVYFLSVISFREKTYEELKAEQREKVDKLFPVTTNMDKQTKTMKDKHGKKKVQKKTQVKEKPRVESKEVSAFHEKEKSTSHGDKDSSPNVESGPVGQEKKKLLKKKSKSVDESDLSRESDTKKKNEPVTKFESKSGSKSDASGKPTLPPPKMTKQKSNSDIETTAGRGTQSTTKQKMSGESSPAVHPVGGKSKVTNEVDGGSVSRGLMKPKSGTADIAGTSRKVQQVSMKTKSSVEPSTQTIKQKPSSETNIMPTPTATKHKTSSEMTQVVGKQKSSNDTNGAVSAQGGPGSKTSTSDSQQIQKSFVAPREMQPAPQRLGKVKTPSPSGGSPSHKPAKFSMVNGEIPFEEGETISVIEMIPQKATLEVSDVNARPQREGKRKKKQLKTDLINDLSAELSASGLRLLGDVRKAELTNQEIQALIDALLNKHLDRGPESEWIESGAQGKDTLTYLKKQLNEQTSRLDEQKKLCESYQDKLRELRGELRDEKLMFSQAKLAHKENLNKQHQEIQSLQSRIHITQEKYNGEKQSLQMQIKQYQEQVRLSNQIKEEHKNLQQRLAGFEAEKSRELQHLQQELERQFGEKLSASFANAQQENHVMKSEFEEIIRKNNEEESSLRSQIHHLKTNYQQLEQANTALSTDLHKTQESCRKSEKECVELKEHLVKIENEKNKDDLLGKLEDSDKLRCHFESQLKELRMQFSESATRNSEKDAEINRLREENEMLEARVSTFSLRPAAEGQENDTQVIEQPEEKKKDDEVETKYQVIINEKDTLLADLNSELNIQKERNDSLQESLKEQRKKNNELREKNWKAMDALSSAEKNAADTKKQCDSLISDSIRKIQEEERKSLEDTLRRIFPAIIIEDVKDHTDWVCKFEAAACSSLEELSTQQASDEPQCNMGHDEQITTLQGQVTQYKSVLAKTEGILKQLEASVNAEEGVWQTKLRDKDSHIATLIRERDSLATQIQTLEESFEEVRIAQEAASEVCGVKFAFSCIEKSLPNILGEMQSKLRELQDKLAGEEEEKADLAKKFDESHRSCSDLQAQLEKTNERLATVDELQKQIVDLQSQQEFEKTTSKELAEQNVKLSSLVQSTQEALQREQQLVSQLQEELERLKNQSVSATANGPSSETASLEHGSKK